MRLRVSPCNPTSIFEKDPALASSDIGTNCKFRAGLYFSRRAKPNTSKDLRRAPYTQRLPQSISQNKTTHNAKEIPKTLKSVSDCWGVRSKNQHSGPGLARPEPGLALSRMAQAQSQPGPGRRGPGLGRHDPGLGRLRPGLCQPIPNGLGAEVGI